MKISEYDKIIENRQKDGIEELSLNKRKIKDNLLSHRLKGRRMAGRFESKTLSSCSMPLVFSVN